MHFKNELNIFENSEKIMNVVFDLSENALHLDKLYLLSITTEKENI